MIAFRQRLHPWLTARLRRACELDAPGPGNTLSLMNANPKPVKVLRGVAWSISLFGAGLNEVNEEGEITKLMTDSFSTGRFQ